MEKGKRIKGERRGRKGDRRRESRTPCPPFKLAPIWLDTLLINRYNEPMYFINMNWPSFPASTYI